MLAHRWHTGDTLARMLAHSWRTGGAQTHMLGQYLHTALPCCFQRHAVLPKLMGSSDHGGLSPLKLWVEIIAPFRLFCQGLDHQQESN